MGMLAWAMMGIALWHFAIFIPDRFWGGIVGSFLAAVIGSIIFGLIVNGFDIPGTSDTELVTALEAIPGTLIGLAVAYARAAILDDVLTATEIGRFEDGADGLAKLIAHLLEPRGEDPLLRGAVATRITSRELRSFLVLPTFDDIGLTVALEHRGIRSVPMDDARASVRCLNLPALASRLDVDLLPAEDGASFLRRILPPDGMVYWPADRF